MDLSELDPEAAQRLLLVVVERAVEAVKPSGGPSRPVPRSSWRSRPTKVNPLTGWF